MLAQATDMGQEPVRAAGRVAADEDVGAVAVRVGDLCQGGVEDSDVIGGGVRPGPTVTQQPGQRLAATVKEAEQWVVAERLLPGRVADSLSEWQITIEASRSSTRPGTGCPAAVDVGSPPRVSAACAHASSRALARAARNRASASPSTSDSTRHAVGSEATAPNSSRLVAQDRQVGDRLAAVGEHHRHVDRDPTRVMPTLPLPQPGQSLTERAGQPGRISHIGQQAGARVSNHAPPVPAAP